MIPQAAIAFTSNQVLHGDCLELMRDIPDKSVDMILCDLPYGTTDCKWDVIIPFEPLWEQYKRIVKPNAAIVLTASQPFTSQLVMSNPKWFKYEWIWEKSMATGGFGINTSPLKAHENILVFSKKIGIFNQQREPGAGYIRPEGKKQASIVGDRNGGYLTVVDDGRCPRSILKIRNPNHGSLHPTQKPVALFEYLVKTYTNEGDLVLDNCAGSGTTAIACLNTNRNYILMEKEQQYIDVIHERLSQPRQLRLIA